MVTIISLRSRDSTRIAVKGMKRLDKTRRQTTSSHYSNTVKNMQVEMLLFRAA